MVAKPKDAQNMAEAAKAAAQEAQEEAASQSSDPATRFNWRRVCKNIKTDWSNKKLGARILPRNAKFKQLVRMHAYRLNIQHAIRNP
jgi:hypothetical protein